jgi:hypothetical protein
MYNTYNGGVIMNPITELQNIFDSIHNINSTATKPAEFEFKEEPQKDNWFDKLVLRWF